MHPRSATAFRYPADVMAHGRSIDERTMRLAGGISKPGGDSMIPPMTVPHGRGSWTPVLTESVNSTEFFGSNMVEDLNTENFSPFIAGLEKALIMFYNPEKQDNVKPAREFGRAAERPRQYNHAYGAVNCSVNNDLCVKEGATNVPMFRLYSNGFDLSTIVHGKNFNSQHMLMLMKMTPVLTQPKQDYGVHRKR